MVHWELRRKINFEPSNTLVVKRRQATSPSTLVTSMVKLLVLLLPTLPQHFFGYEIACRDDTECSAKLKLKSSCIEGKCSNPFHSGCLRVIAEEQGDYQFSGIRECNSDDDPHFAACSRGPFKYDEVRIAIGNWESVILLSWVYQIFLSEVLDVPVTIENNVAGSCSFYDINSDFTYSDIAYNFDSLKEAHRVDGDCTVTSKCAHVLPEVWEGPTQQITDGQGKWFSFFLNSLSLLSC